MPLQVWLPLIGNTENNGLSNFVFAIDNSTYVTIDNAGKLGKCYNFSSSATNRGIYSNDNGFMDKYINNHSFSLCAWVKTSSSDTNVISLSYGLRLFAGDKDHTYLSLYNQTRTVNCYSTVGINDGNWHHLTGTYNTITNNISFYVDGVNTQTAVYTIGYTYSSSWNNGLFIGRDPNNSTVNDHYLFNGKLQDVRIYDHALSPKEVKLLSQGLVAHYQFNDSYSTSNLFPNGFGQDGALGWISNSAISTTETPPNQPAIKASYYSGNRMTSYIPISHADTYTISLYIKAISGATGNTYPSIYPYDVDKKFIDHHKCTAGFGAAYMTTLAQPLHKGDTVIYATNLSAWTTSTDNYYYHVAIFGYADSTGYVYPDMGYTADSPSFGSKTDKSHIDKTNNTITLLAPFTGEDRPAGTTICQATEGGTYFYPFGGIAVSTISDWTYKTGPLDVNSTRLRFAKYINFMAYSGAYYAGIQLLDNNANQIVYDSSGYNYHGKNYNTLSSIDSPRNKISISFDGTSSYIEMNNMAFMPTLLPAEWTMSFWVYNNDASNRSIIFSNYGLGGVGGVSFGFEKSTGELLRVAYNNGTFDRTIPNSTMTVGAWTFFAVSKTTAHEVKVYRNGVLIDTYTNSNCTSSGVVYRFGSDSRSDSTRFNGKLSDFRIYATVLSADDVLNLYNAPVSVANNGAMITQGEFVEV